MPISINSSSVEMIQSNIVKLQNTVGALALFPQGIHESGDICRIFTQTDLKIKNKRTLDARRNPILKIKMDFVCDSTNGY